MVFWDKKEMKKRKEKKIYICRNQISCNILWFFSTFYNLQRKKYNIGVEIYNKTNTNGKRNGNNFLVINFWNNFFWAWISSLTWSDNRAVRFAMLNCWSCWQHRNLCFVYTSFTLSGFASVQVNYLPLILRHVLYSIVIWPLKFFKS